MQATVGDIADFYRDHPEYIGQLDVLTHDNTYKTIEYADVTLRDADVYKVTLDSGKSIECSYEHLLYVTGKGWVKYKDLHVGDCLDTVDGGEFIADLKDTGTKDDLYDLQVDGKEFIANDIRTHNSSFIEATCFALFGKTIRKVPKNNLVNTKNQKGTMVELKFISNDKTYLVRRGIKPSKFEIYEGKTLVAQDASVREYQEKLDSIIGIDYNTFIQTVIISKTKYVPFMRLDAASRREFVENLLTLTIFGNMNKKQKLVMSSLKEQLQTLKSDFSIAKNNIVQAENNVRSINEVLQQNLTEKRDYINNRIDELKDINNELKETAKKLKATLYVDEHDTINLWDGTKRAIGDLEVELKHRTRVLTRLKSTSDKCTSCGQELTAEHVEHTNKNIQVEERDIAICKDNLDRDRKLLVDLQPTFDLVIGNMAIEQDLKGMVLKIKHNIKQIEDIERERDNIVFDDNNDKLDEAKNKLQQYRTDCATIAQQLKECNEEFEYNSIVYDMLKDGGIKASIIEKSIPLINSVINKNLSKFGFFVQFKLDNEFNETIKQRGIDVLTYDSFSEGEKLRMDMAVLLAWREVAQLQNNLSCNVLLFDEMTDASMDFEGSEILGSMLSELEDTHVFVITHSPEKLQTYADGAIHIKKENGYSKIS